MGNIDFFIKALVVLMFGALFCVMIGTAIHDIKDFKSYNKIDSIICIVIDIILILIAVTMITAVFFIADMKIKKSTMSTRLRDIYGDRTDDYSKYITVGREFWYYFTDYEVTHITNSGWCKIRITYVRSGAAFYVFSDFPEIPERFFPVSSFMASILIYAEIDPEKDIECLGNIKKAKLKIRFDDKHTIVHNWPNEEEVEIDENEIDYFDSLLSV